MAKGRKLYGADRLLGPCRLAGDHVSTATAAGDLADLGEEDVWYSSTAEPEINRTGPSQPSRSGACPAGRDVRPVGGLSRVFSDGRHVAASAPVEVPVWHGRFNAEPAEPVVAEPEQEEEDDMWAPPHVYLARKAAKAVAASVVEGAGRTLKGRDVSRVRDAVWSRTGFYG